MNIVNNNSSKKCFHQVNVGDVFALQDKYYIKTFTIEDYNGEYNAVNLNTGRHAQINHNTEVLVLDHELIIK